MSGSPPSGSPTEGVWPQWHHISPLPTPLLHSIKKYLCQPPNRREGRAPEPSSTHRTLFLCFQSTKNTPSGPWHTSSDQADHCLPLLRSQAQTTSQYRSPSLLAGSSPATAPPETRPERTASLRLEPSRHPSPDPPLGSRPYFLGGYVTWRSASVMLPRLVLCFASSLVQADEEASSSDTLPFFCTRNPTSRSKKPRPRVV